jgi:putative hydrolase of the HAD superfamily
MIKGIIFDFDGVVYLEKPRFGFVLSEKFNIPYENILPFFENELAECQLGDKDLKVELRKYIEKWRIESTPEKLMKMWFENGEINKEVVENIKRLKKNGIVCLLTTSNEKYRFEYLVKKYNLEKLFDKLMPSYNIKARKPDKKVYEFIFNLYEFKPSEYLYFDDSAKNIDIGKSLGINSYVFEDNRKFRKVLESLAKNY